MFSLQATGNETVRGSRVTVMVTGTKGGCSDDLPAMYSHTLGQFLGMTAMQGRSHHGNPVRWLWSRLLMACRLNIGRG